LNGRPRALLRPGEHAIYCEHRAPTTCPGPFQRVVRRHNSQLWHLDGIVRASQKATSGAT